MKKILMMVIVLAASPVTNLNAQEPDEAEEIQEEQTIPPEAFLAALVGDFRGRGEVLVGAAKDKDKVSCKLSNAMDETSRTLAIKGTCATTQGRVNVDGTLKMDGETGITGSFISTNANSEVTKSNSVYDNGTLTLSTSMVHKQTGNLSRTRQVVVTNGEGGFQSTFYRFENASGGYKETGSVEFGPITQ